MRKLWLVWLVAAAGCDFDRAFANCADAGFCGPRPDAGAGGGGGSAGGLGGGSAGGAAGGSAGGAAGGGAGGAGGGAAGGIGGGAAGGAGGGTAGASDGGEWLKLLGKFATLDLTEGGLAGVSSDDVWLGTSFRGSVDYGTGTPLTSGALRDAVFTRYGKLGSVVSQIVFSDGGDETAAGIGVDDAGDVFMVVNLDSNEQIGSSSIRGPAAVLIEQVPDGGLKVNWTNGNGPGEPHAGKALAVSPGGLATVGTQYFRNAYVNSGTWAQTCAHPSGGPPLASGVVWTTFASDGSCYSATWMVCDATVPINNLSIATIQDVAIDRSNNHLFAAVSVLDAGSNDCRLGGTRFDAGIDALVAIQQQWPQAPVYRVIDAAGPLGAKTRIAARDGRIFLAGSIRASSTELNLVHTDGGLDIYVVELLATNLQPDPSTLLVLASDGDDTVERLELAPDGALWLSGEYRGAGFAVGTQVFGAASPQDAGLFLARFTPGAVLTPTWAGSISSRGSAAMTGLAFDAQGAPFLAGTVLSPGAIDFQTDAGVLSTQTQPGLPSVFVGRPRLK